MTSLVYFCGVLWDMTVHKHTVHKSATNIAQCILSSALHIFLEFTSSSHFYNIFFLWENGIWLPNPLPYTVFLHWLWSLSLFAVQGIFITQSSYELLLQWDLDFRKKHCSFFSKQHWTLDHLQVSYVWFQHIHFKRACGLQSRNYLIRILNMYTMSRHMISC